MTWWALCFVDLVDQHRGKLVKWGWRNRTARGGVSVLAAVETILACGASFYLAYAYEALIHIAISAAIAPFLMLRSPASIEDAANRFNAFISQKSAKTHKFPLFSLYPQLLLSALYYRVRSVIFNLKEGMPRVAQNYADALLRTEAISEVSLMPNTASVDDIIDGLTKFGDSNELFFIKYCIIVVILSISSYVILGISDYLGYFETNTSFFIFIIMSVAASILALNLLSSNIFWFLAFWFRLSVKSTAIIWVPLIYLASKAPKSFANAKTAIIEERQSDYAGLIRVFAWFSLCLFLFRVFVFPSMAGWWQQQVWAQPLLVFLLPVGAKPDDLHPWHLASGVTAVLTLTTYYLIWEAYGRPRETRKPVGAKIARAYLVYFWMRGILSIYLIGWGFWLAWKGVQLINLPSVSACWLPLMTACNPS